MRSSRCRRRQPWTYDGTNSVFMHVPGDQFPPASDASIGQTFMLVRGRDHKIGWSGRQVVNDGLLGVGQGSHLAESPSVVTSGFRERPHFASVGHYARKVLRSFRRHAQDPRA